MSDNTLGQRELYNECQTIQWGKQSSTMIVRQYNGVNRAVQWLSDNTMR
jgi:hypothetical protein